MINKQKQGKRNRISGANFERRVRKDLEKKGWIVSRWCNNIYDGELRPAKSTRFRSNTHGFPDFIVYALRKHYSNSKWFPVILGIECKSNGKLSKEEKLKLKWYKEKEIFSDITIAKKGEKRGEIIYNEFRYTSL